MEAAAGPSSLRISTQLDEGGPHDLIKTVEIHPAHYRTGSLTVSPKFVEPGPDEQKEIAADAEIKTKAHLHRVRSSRCGMGAFVRRCKSPPTDSFGTRRMFNGKLASIHKGMDFRAAEGTVVRASNSGVVVLARNISTTRATA